MSLGRSNRGLTPWKVLLWVAAVFLVAYLLQQSYDSYRRIMLRRENAKTSNLALASVLKQVQLGESREQTLTTIRTGEWMAGGSVIESDQFSEWAVEHERASDRWDRAIGLVSQKTSIHWYGLIFLKDDRVVMVKVRSMDYPYKPPPGAPVDRP